MPQRKRYVYHLPLRSDVIPPLELLSPPLTDSYRPQMARKSTMGRLITKMRAATGSNTGRALLTFPLSQKSTEASMMAASRCPSAVFVVIS